MPPMCRRSIAALTIIALLLSVPRAARADEIDDYVVEALARQHVPGASLAVMREGQIVKAKGYGLANVELDVPASPETVYKIASVSKQFFAAAILLLAADGKLTLDQPIAEWIDDAPEAWRPITIRQLLSHTSGIVREAPAFDPLRPQPDIDVVRSAYPLPLRFAPGERWEYCNVGYFALGEIVARASGQSWPDFMRERIFAPLEMGDTRETTIEELVPRRADGYLWRGGQWRNAATYLAVRPSGAFLSTVLDLARWDAALRSEQILSEAQRAEMWTPITLLEGKTHPYGLGWFVDRDARGRRVRHGGSQPGFRSEFVRYLDRPLSVVLLTNGDDARCEPIVRRVVELVLADDQAK